MIPAGKRIRVLICKLFGINSAKAENVEPKESDKPKKSNRQKEKLLAVFPILFFLYLFAALYPYAVVPEYSNPAQIEKMIKPIGPEGNRALILVSGEEALDARIQTIANAKESIIISSYVFADDESGHQVASALMAAADRGVKIRIITDGLIGKDHLKKSDLGYVLGAHQNMLLCYYNPMDWKAPSLINLRHHEKFMISDTEILIFGGRNISDEFLTQPSHPSYNIDLDVLIYSSTSGDDNPSVTLLGHFDRMWEELCTPVFTSIPENQIQSVHAFENSLRDSYDELCLNNPQLMKNADWSSLTVPIDGFAILTNPTDIALKKPVLWSALITLMKNAQERVWLQTPYLVLNKAMKKDLQEVADAPEKLAVLINSRATGNNVIAAADFLIQNRNLSKIDMNLYQFQGDHSVHTKALLIDSNISVFGSFNFDIRSAYINTESMLVVYSEKINAGLEEHMKEMFSLSTPMKTSSSDEIKNLPLPQPIDFVKNLRIHLLAPFVWLVRFIV